MFNSGGGCAFLFGKLLLRCFQAVHDYHTDTVSIQSSNKSAVLHGNTVVELAEDGLKSGMERQGNSLGGSSSMNPPSTQVLHLDVCYPWVQNDKSGLFSDCVEDVVERAKKEVLEDKSVPQVEECIMKAKERNKGEQEEEHGTDWGGGEVPPLREVQDHIPASEEAKKTNSLHTVVSKYMVDVWEDRKSIETTNACQTELPELEHEDLSGGNAEPSSRGVPTHHIDHQNATLTDMPCLVLPVTNSAEASSKEAIYTCHTDLFLQAHVTKTLELVQIGEDITEVQHDKVKALISEFTDCFAWSLSEVNLRPGAVHKLNIPENTTFRTKIPQHSFNPDQKVFMAEKVQEMFKGGIIRPMHPGSLHRTIGLSSQDAW